MKILHRFYDLYSGGGEVVVGTFVEAFSEHQHVLVFNRHRPSWLSAKLARRSNVKLLPHTGGQVGGVIDQEAPDLIFFHYYPPMSVKDFNDLSPEIRAQTVIYSHWFQNVPIVEGVRRYCFPSPFGARAGKDIPEDQKLVVLNPVAERFFQVRRVLGRPFTVGRHSRDQGIKFSEDFMPLFEQIEVPDLQVVVLGSPPELAQVLSTSSYRARHNYWMLPLNTMDVARFLRFVDVFVYKTHDSFAETCPLVILEALAAGIPVVAEAKGGVVDLVMEGETGFLCRSHADYKAAVETLYRNPVLHSRYSKSARQWAKENASLMHYRHRIGDEFGLL